MCCSQCCARSFSHPISFVCFLKCFFVCLLYCYTHLQSAVKIIMPGLPKKTISIVICCLPHVTINKSTFLPASTLPRCVVSAQETITAFLIKCRCTLGNRSRHTTQAPAAHAVFFMHKPDSYANIISDELPMLKYALAASQSLLTFLNLFIDYVQIRNEDDIENHHIQYLWS